MAKKIFLDASDDFKAVLKTVVSTKDREVVLILPHNSLFGRNLDNFENLKKELSRSGKSVVFESVNEEILQKAETAGFAVSHPLFQREERIFSDILPNNSGHKLEIKRDDIEIKKNRKEEEVEVETEEEEISGESAANERPAARRSARFRRPINSRRMLIRILVGAGFAGVVVLALIALPKATINLSLKKFEIPFDKSVVAGASVKNSEIKDGKIFLAGELLVAKNNIQMSFAASGREDVQIKARGKLTIYNSFGSQSQSLVATTRLVSPEGKIFRLDNPVTVPGAKIVNGKIENSSIEVAVTADKAGPEYNLAASGGKWRIPGFEGTPKYEGFYAEAKTPLTGGFAGEKSVPTPEDLKNARVKIEEALNSNLLSQVAVLMNGDLKLLPDAQKFSVISFQETETAPDGQFGIFAEGELRYLVFRETDLKSILVSDLEKNIESSQALNVELGDFSADYEKSEFDLAAGLGTFSYKGAAVFQPVFSVGFFIAQISGLSEDKLREKMLAVPGLEKGKISLWPFWVKSAPISAGRIELNLE